MLVHTCVTQWRHLPMSLLLRRATDARPASAKVQSLCQRWLLSRLLLRLQVKCQQPVRYTLLGGLANECFNVLLQRLHTLRFCLQQERRKAGHTSGVRQLQLRSNGACCLCCCFFSCHCPGDPGEGAGAQPLQDCRLSKALRRPLPVLSEHTETGCKEVSSELADAIKLHEQRFPILWIRQLEVAKQKSLLRSRRFRAAAQELCDKSACQILSLQRLRTCCKCCCRFQDLLCIGFALFQLHLGKLLHLLCDLRPGRLCLPESLHEVILPQNANHMLQLLSDDECAKPRLRDHLTLLGLLPQAHHFVDDFFCCRMSAVQEALPHAPARIIDHELLEVMCYLSEQVRSNGRVCLLVQHSCNANLQRNNAALCAEILAHYLRKS
mmetsp:Transcript_33241/g.77742  ORF Transcript_33241/g.77742 Transcript_33241/m.77742 type:complete len:381 (+) Transcript_33241:94-1236(+)